MREHRFPSRYDAYLLVAALLWGTEFPVAKAIYRELSPLAFLFLRNSIALLTLLAVLALRGGREPWRPLSPGEKARALAWGALGNGLAPICAYVGLAYTTAGNASLLINTSPVFVFVFAAVIWRRETSRASWLGVLLSFAGIYLLLHGRASLAGYSRETLLGDVICLGAPVGWALYTTAIQPLLRERSALRMVCLTCGVGTAVILPFAFGELQATAWGEISWSAAVGTLYMGVAVTAICYLCWNLGIAHLGSSRTVAYNYLPPVIAWALGVTLLAETYYHLQIAAAVCVFMGLYLARRR